MEETITKEELISYMNETNASMADVRYKILTSPEQIDPNIDNIELIMTFDRSINLFEEILNKLNND